jgi:hypothetical protein
MDREERKWTNPYKKGEKPFLVLSIEIMLLWPQLSVLSRSNGLSII